MPLIRRNGFRYLPASECIAQYEGEIANLDEAIDADKRFGLSTANLEGMRAKLQSGLDRFRAMEPGALVNIDEN